MNLNSLLSLFEISKTSIVKPATIVKLTMHSQHYNLLWIIIANNNFIVWQGSLQVNPSILIGSFKVKNLQYHTGNFWKPTNSILMCQNKQCLLIQPAWGVMGILAVHRFSTDLAASSLFCNSLGPVFPNWANFYFVSIELVHLFSDKLTKTYLGFHCKCIFAFSCYLSDSVHFLYYQVNLVSHLMWLKMQTK